MVNTRSSSRPLLAIAPPPSAKKTQKKPHVYFASASKGTKTLVASKKIKPGVKAPKSNKSKLTITKKTPTQSYSPLTPPPTPTTSKNKRPVNKKKDLSPYDFISKRQGVDVALKTKPTSFFKGSKFEFKYRGEDRYGKNKPLKSRLPLKADDYNRKYNTQNWRFVNLHNDNVVFHCKLKSKRCPIWDKDEVTKKRSFRCNEQTELGVPYCKAHLKSRKYLIYKYVNAKSTKTDKNRKHVELIVCAPPGKKGEIVFKKDQVILPISGQKISILKLKHRHGDYPLGQFVIPLENKEKNGYVDFSCKRHVASMISREYNKDKYYNCEIQEFKVQDEKTGKEIKRLKLVATQDIEDTVALVIHWPYTTGDKINDGSVRRSLTTNENLKNILGLKRYRQESSHLD